MNVISFFTANRSVKNSPQATRSRTQTIASTPQTDSTVLQQQVTALNAPLPLDSNPVKAALATSADSKSVRTSVSRLKAGSGSGSMWQPKGVLVVYREADVKEAEVIGHGACVLWEGHDSTSAVSLSLDGGAAYTATCQKEWFSFLHLYSRCTKTKIKETFRTFLMKSVHPNNKSTIFDQLNACPAKRSHAFKMLWSIANMCVEVLIFMHFDKITNYHLSTISLSHGKELRVLEQFSM